MTPGTSGDKPKLLAEVWSQFRTEVHMPAATEEMCEIIFYAAAHTVLCTMAEVCKQSRDVELGAATLRAMLREIEDYLDFHRKHSRREVQ